MLYNLACLHCGIESFDAAVDYFVRSIEAGYASQEWIDNDSDLDPIRDHPRFQAALEKLG